MGPMRMVPVAKVHHPFEARVLVARLGSEGIVVQLRGSVDGPYPVGAVELLVEERDAEEAREILASGPEPDGETSDEVTTPARPARAALLVVVIVGVLVYAVVSVVGDVLG